MDWLTFIAAVVDSLAWPAVAITLVFVLRARLPDFVATLRRLKFKDLELEFEASTEAIEKRSGEVIPEVKQEITVAGNTASDIRARLSQIAEVSPRTAILEAWLIVERAAVDVIRKKGISEVETTPGPLRLLHYLRKGQILNEPLLGLFDELRVLRNEAVHVADAQFTPRAVWNYIRVAIRMAAHLEAIADGL